LVRREPSFSAVNPSLILDELLGQTKKELEQQRVHLELRPSTFLPAAWIDSKQLRNALERVMDFCRVLLAKGGNLRIETRIRNIAAVDYLELVWTATSAAPLEVDENDVFRPFLRINNRPIGLGMALVNDLLRRNRGSVQFSKETPRSGKISILLQPCVQ
jgi:hypothetical protein